jgi:hypothetical protein
MNHPIEPGIYDMPDEQYFDFPAFSNSDLKLISRSPAHYYAEKRDPNRSLDNDTASKAAGRAIHCAILEPGDFPNRYIIAPEDAPRKPTIAQINMKVPSEKAIESMEFWTDFNERAGGKEILKAEDYASYMEVTKQVREHPELRDLLKDGLAEKCVFAVDPKTGLLVKCKTDYFRQFSKMAVIIDLKTTKDARPFSFQRDAYTYGYFQQAAFYSDVWKWAGLVSQIDTWIILAVEREKPYAVMLYEVSGEDIEFGRKQYRKALAIAEECNATDTWPAYNTDIVPLKIPGYASVE